VTDSSFRGQRNTISQKKSTLIETFTKEEEEEEKSRILASNLAQQQSILFALPVFFFPSFVEFRALDLSCDLCIRAHIHQELLWGDSIL